MFQMNLFTNETFAQSTNSFVSHLERILFLHRIQNNTNKKETLSLSNTSPNAAKPRFWKCILFVFSSFYNFIAVFTFILIILNCNKWSENKNQIYIELYFFHFLKFQILFTFVIFVFFSKIVCSLNSITNYFGQ